MGSLAEIYLYFATKNLDGQGEHLFDLTFPNLTLKVVLSPSTTTSDTCTRGSQFWISKHVHAHQASAHQAFASISGLCAWPSARTKAGGPVCWDACAAATSGCSASGRARRSALPVRACARSCAWRVRVHFAIACVHAHDERAHGTILLSRRR